MLKGYFCNVFLLVSILYRKFELFIYLTFFLWYDVFRIGGFSNEGKVFAYW